jgi:hypothetical protein
MFLVIFSFHRYCYPNQVGIDRKKSKWVNTGGFYNKSPGMVNQPVQAVLPYHGDGPVKSRVHPGVCFGIGQPEKGFFRQAAAKKTGFGELRRNDQVAAPAGISPKVAIAVGD